jgi:hypothetical protein
MKRLIIASVLMLSGTSLLAQYEWITSATAAGTEDHFESFGYSAYIDQYSNDAWGWITGHHCLDWDVYCDSFETFHAPYSGHYNFFGTAWLLYRQHSVGLSAVLSLGERF